MNTCRWTKWSTLDSSFRMCFKSEQTLIFFIIADIPFSAFIFEAKRPPSIVTLFMLWNLCRKSSDRKRVELSSNWRSRCLSLQKSASGKCHIISTPSPIRVNSSNLGKTCDQSKIQKFKNSKKKRRKKTKARVRCLFSQVNLTI